MNEVLQGCNNKISPSLLPCPHLDLDSPFHVLLTLGMVGSWFLVEYIKTEGVGVKLLCSCSYQNSSVNALHNILRRNRIKFMLDWGNSLGWKHV